MSHSPFPGMDPYLEASTIWPDVHTTLMCIVGEQLTPLLAPKYLAELETRVVIDRVDDDAQSMILPDPPVPLDLGQALRTAYERARYDLRVDYRKPPAPPLSSTDAAWAAALLGLAGEKALEDDR